MGDFRLALKAEGSNPIYWETLDSLLSLADIRFDPEWSFTEQSEVVRTQSGLGYARGFATASWFWAALTREQRAILRAFCPGISSEVYIETKTNEITPCGDDEFIQCLAIAHWTGGDEDQQADKTMGVEILFTHLQEIA